MEAGAGPAVHPAARIADNVEIGRWSIIGADVEIGANTIIGPHTIISGPTRIGRDNHIFPFCSIGEPPQDKKFGPEEVSRLEIGDRNTIREYCSVNRGTTGGGGVTRIGNDNWIMASCHIAHDCQVGNNTIFANNATLAGHVEIHDHVILGGFTGVHQFCRLGESSFTAISAVVVKDVPPFVIVDGNTAKPRGLNRVGLKRRGFTPADLDTLRRAYRMLFRSGMTVEAALAELSSTFGDNQHVACMVDFARSSERGIVR